MRTDHEFVHALIVEGEIETDGNSTGCLEFADWRSCAVECLIPKLFVQQAGTYNGAASDFFVSPHTAVEAVTYDRLRIYL